MTEFENKTYTVTAITRLIKHTLEESFEPVWVEGELSNFIHHSSGHRYMTLKDENASLRVVMWRSAGQYLKFEPENGMQIRVYGELTVYEKSGQYQLVARQMIPVGVGELEVAFRQLYEKLSKEGLFDPGRKKRLPSYPMKIGIVTSPTGAAIRDIIQIGRRRNDAIHLIIYPALVQGYGSAKSIKAGIEYFNSRDDIDVIITGRGGGSLEDLWAFNEELTVRAIVASRIPVVSAVGHEIDTTLSDLAADLRAPTPSAAAELVIWDKQDFMAELKGLVDRGNYSMEKAIHFMQDALRSNIRRGIYRRPEALIYERHQRLDNVLRAFDFAAKNGLDFHKNTLSLAVSRLESLSPLSILERGYAVIRRLPEAETIKSVRQLKPGQELEIILNDGKIIGETKKITRNK